MADKPLITPRTLGGFRDRLPKEAMAKEKLTQNLIAVFESFGFVPIETPHLEYADILVKQGSEEIQKELYRFKDHGGRDVVLRFDQTVPLARFISQYKSELDLPFKRFVIGNVFRGERAQKGRYREFTQCDFDFIGSDSIACDAEIIQVIYASLARLGLDEFTIWVNHRSILNGICHHFGIKNERDIQSVLRIIDKLDKIGKEGVSKELESALGFSQEKTAPLLQAISIKQCEVSSEFFAKIAHMKEWNEELAKGISELEEMFEILSDLEMDKSITRVNFAIARGLGYYTGIVYETTLNRLKNIGSVCSGGRYDDLTRTFSQERLSGVGASIGLDRLIAALEELEMLEGKSTSARVLVAVMERKFFAYAHKIAEALRSSGIYTEVYPQDSKLKKQLSYAHNKGHEYCVIIGEDEFATHTMTLKNMTTGMQFENLSLLKTLEIVRG
ncbi:histidine--tRNA ligase [Helicobacter sp. CLO-3]|nr:histidine--tRNA ligase [Helicobacter sp. CLO-3]OHU85921.1 histidine--tRNA ligase [Helicobacter sp. CLO-3]